MTPEKPNKIKAYFMKAEEEDMREFRKEIDLLFQPLPSARFVRTEVSGVFSIFGESTDGN